MTLKQWVKEQGGRRTVAKKLGVTPQCVGYWIHRINTPRISTIIELTRLSRKKLTIDSIIRDTSH